MAVDIETCAKVRAATGCTVEREFVASSTTLLRTEDCAFHLTGTPGEITQAEKQLEDIMAKVAVQKVDGRIPGWARCDYGKDFDAALNRIRDMNKVQWRAVAGGIVLVGEKASVATAAVAVAEVLKWPWPSYVELLEEQLRFFDVEKRGVLSAKSGCAGVRLELGEPRVETLMRRRLALIGGEAAQRSAAQNVEEVIDRECTVSVQRVSERVMPRLRALMRVAQGSRRPRDVCPGDPGLFAAGVWQVPIPSSRTAREEAWIGDEKALEKRLRDSTPTPLAPHGKPPVPRRAMQLDENTNILTIVGPKEAVAEMAEEIGRMETDASERCVAGQGERGPGEIDQAEEGSRAAVPEKKKTEGEEKGGAAVANEAAQQRDGLKAPCEPGAASRGRDWQEKDNQAKEEAKTEMDREDQSRPLEEKEESGGDADAEAGPWRSPKAARDVRGLGSRFPKGAPRGESAQIFDANAKRQQKMKERGGCYYECPDCYCGRFIAANARAQSVYRCAMPRVRPSADQASAIIVCDRRQKASAWQAYRPISAEEADQRVQDWHKTVPLVLEAGKGWKWDMGREQMARFIRARFEKTNGVAG